MAPGKIILINGASSSGKTSIVRALQEVMVEPYLDAGIDKFIWMLPKRYLDRPLWDDVLGLATRAGQVGHRLFSGMHHSIAALSEMGNNVVADHVLVERQWLVECACLFGELPAYFVGVYCPLDVLEQREATRKDRTLGQAKAQAPLVHSHGIYDLKVDSSRMSVQECAHLVRQRIESGAPPMAFKHLRESLLSNNHG